MRLLQLVSDETQTRQAKHTEVRVDQDTVGRNQGIIVLEEEVRGHLGHLADDVVVGGHFGLLGVGGVRLGCILFPPVIATAYDPLDLSSRE